jgi:RNA polymerase sigma-70 factor (ECF subfamily)
MSTPRPLTDAEIVALYLARDESAIDHTAKNYGAYCLSVAMNILNNHPDAEECVNDTYLRAWNSIPPAKPNSLQAFLAAITRRLSLDRYRKQRAAKRNRDLEVSFEELSDMVQAPDERANELPELLNAFLRTLDSRERRLFLRRYWVSVSLEALANEEGTTKNAVTVRLYKTRNKLKVYLQERGYTV